jgi:hypothetical protein
MKPEDIEKWLADFDLSGVCDGLQFNALMPAESFWLYVEEGGSVHNPLKVMNHGNQVELKLLPVYDPEVLNFFHISPKSFKIMCRHDLNNFKRVYEAQGGSFGKY